MSFPTPPDGWVPPSLSDPTGVYRAQVVVAQVLPDFEILGELLQAVVADGRWEDDLGSSGVTISVPTDDVSIDLLTGDKTIWANKVAGRVSLLNRELAVVVDGKVVGWYSPRGQARIAKGTLTMDCVSLLDGYLPGRTLGAVPYDYLLGRGDFEDVEDLVGDLQTDGGYAVLGLPAGFTWTGDPDDIRWVAGPRSSRALMFRGDAFDEDDPARLRVQIGVTVAETTTFNNIFRASAFMKLYNATQDYDDQLLMTMERFDVGEAQRVWPRPQDAFPDEMIAVIDGSRLTGDWDTTPVTAAAVAKRGPYDSVFRVDVYPLSSTTWTFLDELRIFRRDTLGTGSSQDLTDHLVLLMEDAQDGPGKSTWNLPIERGTDTGVNEVGVWRREVWQPNQDAVAALCAREDGPAWPYVNSARELVCTAENGTDRSEEFTIDPDDIVIDEGWVVDPGAEKTQVISETDYGSDYWRHVSIDTDTSRADGHVIEELIRGPNGMGLRPLDQFTRKELALRSQPQATRRVWVRPRIGWVVAPRDTVTCYSVDGRVKFHHRVTCTRREFHDQRGLIALDLGVDEPAEEDE